MTEFVFAGLFVDVEGNTSALDSRRLTFLYDNIGEATSRMTVCVPGQNSSTWVMTQTRACVMALAPLLKLALSVRKSLSFVH